MSVSLYFTYLPRRPLLTGRYKFWVTCSFRGRIRLCRVLSYSFKGFRLCEASNFVIDIVNVNVNREFI